MSIFDNMQFRMLGYSISMEKSYNFVTIVFLKYALTINMNCKSSYFLILEVSEFWNFLWRKRKFWSVQFSVILDLENELNIFHINMVYRLIHHHLAKRRERVSFREKVLQSLSHLYLKTYGDLYTSHWKYHQS